MICSSSSASRCSAVMSRSPSLAARSTASASRFTCVELTGSGNAAIDASSAFVISAMVSGENAASEKSFMEGLLPFGRALSAKSAQDLGTQRHEPCPDPRKPWQHQQLRLHQRKQALDYQQTGCIGGDDHAGAGNPVAMACNSNSNSDELHGLDDANRNSQQQQRLIRAEVVDPRVTACQKTLVGLLGFHLNGGHSALASVGFCDNAVTT